MKKKLLVTSILTLSLALGVGVAAFSNTSRKQANADTSYEGGVTYLSSVKNDAIDIHDDNETEIKSYYNALNNLSSDQRRGTNLLKHLKPILQNNTYCTSYDNVRSWFMITDRDWIQSPIDDPSATYVYPGSEAKMHVLYRTDNGETTAASYAGTHAQGTPGYLLNREHTWAKSRGFKGVNDSFVKSAPGTDLHHLILADTNINSTSHSNYPYGDMYTDGINTSSKTTDVYNTYGIGYRWSDSNNKTWFEPQDQDKGDIARALLYMVARYNNLAGDSMVEVTKDGVTYLKTEANLTLVNMNASNYTNAAEHSTSNHVVSYGDLATLLRWHQLDPVSDFEIHRNNLIDNNYQKNRNPFIDYPEWVDYIWGDSEGYAQPNTDTISQYGHTGMTITGEAQVVIGEQESLDVDITGITGSDTILWESSDTDVATINSNGVLTAVSEGTVTIKAITKDSTFYAEKEIEIVASSAVHVTDVSLSKSSLSLIKDDTYKLTATVLPSNADDKSISWTSSDTNVATVDNGVVTAKAAGSTTITVTTTDGGLTDTCDVTVSPTPSSVTGQSTIVFGKWSTESSALSTSNFLTNNTVRFNDLISGVSSTSYCYRSFEGLKIGRGGNAGSFTANINDSAKNNIKTIRITSEQYGTDTGKLKLSVNGDVITNNITPGNDFSYDFDERTKVNNITIETTANRAYLTSVTFVEEIPVTGVVLDKDAITIEEGETETLVATVSPSTAADKSVIWSSNDETVATVDNGVVTAVNAGTATITVTTVDGGFTATCDVTVEEDSSISHIQDLVTICLGLEEKTATNEYYTFKGTVTGVYGNSFFVQEGSYGMYVYNYSQTSTLGIAKNKVVKVTAKLILYNHQCEAQSVSACEILDETPEQIDPVVVNSYSDITDDMQNTLVTIRGLTYQSGNYNTDSDSSIYFNFGSSSLVYRSNRFVAEPNLTNIGTKITDCKTAARVDLVGVHCVAYNKYFRVNICSADSIVTYTNKQVVQLFVDDYMHMNDYDPTLSGDGDNLCLGENGYYKKAKIALTAMSETQINIFRTDGDFANAKARYEAWAEAFGDTTPYSTEVTPTNALKTFKAKDYVPYIVLAASLATTFALAVLIQIRKKKEQ